MSRLTHITNKSKEVTFRSPILAANEYRRKFRRNDEDSADLALSDEALEHCQAIAFIYFKLCHAPRKFWDPGERVINDRVLLFEAEYQAEEPSAMRGDLLTRPGFRVLIEYLRRSPTTCVKALKWLKKKRVIGYYAVKNGAGVRIWLNVADTGVGHKEGAALATPLPAPAPTPAARDLPPPVTPSATPLNQKNLPVGGGSNLRANSSNFVPALNNSDLEINLDILETHPVSTSISLAHPDALRATSPSTLEKDVTDTNMTPPVMPPAATAPTAPAAEKAAAEKTRADTNTAPPMSATVLTEKAAAQPETVAHTPDTPAPTTAQASTPAAPPSAPVASIVTRSAPLSPVPVVPAPPTTGQTGLLAEQMATALAAFALCWERQQALEAHLLARQTHLEEAFKMQSRQLALSVRQAAAQGGQVAQQEIRHLRDWFTDKALPKAVRVGVAEALRANQRTGGQQAEQERLAAALRVGASPAPDSETAPTTAADDQMRWRREVLAHLAGREQALTTAAQRCPHEAVRPALTELAQTLARYQSELAARAEPFDTEQVDQALVQWEAWLHESLRLSLPAPTCQAAHQQAVQQLAPYRPQMDEKAYAASLANLRDRKLREAVGLPGLGLYAL